MLIRKNILLALSLVLVAVLLLPTAAKAAYDLNGDWTFSYSLPGGDTFNDPCVIQQNGNQFSGQTTYQIEGDTYHDTFEGLVNPDGSVVFTLHESSGDTVYHKGQISPDGRTITGSWSVGENNGSFTISRSSGGSMSQQGALPDLSGEWSFSFTNPEGNTFTDPAVVTQNGNRISGTLTYTVGSETHTEPFEGTVSPDGTVDFTLNDQGMLVQHNGRISPDGSTVTGSWNTQEGADGPFTMTRKGAGAAPSAASSQASLTGEWVFSFETDDGKSYSDPCSIQQNGDKFSGAVTYYDNGEEIQEPFDGTINADGTVQFTLYDMGEAVPHTGKISADGNTISGTWSYDDGSGTFTITRGGYVTGMPAPNTPSQGNTGNTPDLTGNWTFNYTVPDGSQYSDPAVITQQGNHFSGTVTYSDGGESVTHPFDGTIASDGSVDFTLYEDGEPVAHWGRISPDGNTISGEWAIGDGEGDFSLVRN